MSVQSAHERFLKALPSDWDIKSLSDVGSIVGGSTPSRGVKRYWGGEIPWVTPGELTSLAFKYLDDTQEHITQAGLESCGAHLLPPDTLLVTSRATIGAVALASRPISTNQGFKSVVFGPGTEPGFYFHLFKRLIPELTRRASGTTFLEISGREFGAVRVPVPPRSEQRRIAELLDTLDKAIRRTEQIIAKLKQIKQGLLHDLLTRGIDQNGELRDPERHPEQFTKSPLGQIPNNWEVQPLERATLPAAPICYGIVQAGPFVDGGPQVVTIGDLMGDFRTGLHRTSPNIERLYTRSRTQPNDVLLSIKGTIGRVAVVPAWYRGNISRDLARLRFSRSISPSYARYYLQSPRGQRRLELSVVGTTRAEVSIHVLKRFALPLAPQQEQAEIARQLDSADQLLRAEETEAAKLRLLREGLMEDLLTGRVRVTKLEAVA